MAAVLFVACAFQVFATASTEVVAPQALPPPAVQPRDMRTPVDVIVLVDASSSMTTTDPGALRKEAIKVFVDRLDAEDRLGLVAFSGQAEVLSPLQTLGAYGGAARQSLREAIGRIGERGQTNMADALGLGAGLAVPERDTAVILLSDGENTAGDPVQNRFGPHVPIHSIALSKEADLQLMGKLSAETGGTLEVAVTSGDLHRIFANLFAESLRRESIFLWEKQMRTGEQEKVAFVVERGLGELQALLTWSGSRASCTYEAPDGQTYSPADNSTERYGVLESTYLLLNIRDPQPGEWHAYIVADDMAAAGEPVNLSVTAGESEVWTAWHLTWTAPEVGERVSLRLKTDGAAVAWKDAAWTLWRPDGHPQSGMERLTFGAPALPGSTITVWSMRPQVAGPYRVSVRVFGTLSGGLPIARYFDQSMQVFPAVKGIRRQYEILPFIRR